MSSVMSPPRPAPVRSSLRPQDRVQHIAQLQVHTLSAPHRRVPPKPLRTAYSQDLSTPSPTHQRFSLQVKHDSHAAASSRVQQHQKQVPVIHQRSRSDQPQGYASPPPRQRQRASAPVAVSHQHRPRIPHRVSASAMPSQRDHHKLHARSSKDVGLHSAFSAQPYRPRSEQPIVHRAPDGKDSEAISRGRSSLQHIALQYQAPLEYIEHRVSPSLQTHRPATSGHLPIRQSVSNHKESLSPTHLPLPISSDDDQVLKTKKSEKSMKSTKNHKPGKSYRVSKLPNPSRLEKPERGRRSLSLPVGARKNSDVYIVTAGDVSSPEDADSSGFESDGGPSPMSDSDAEESPANLGPPAADYPFENPDSFIKVANNVANETSAPNKDDDRKPAELAASDEKQVHTPPPRPVMHTVWRCSGKGGYFDTYAPFTSEQASRPGHVKCQEQQRQEQERARCASSRRENSNASSLDSELYKDEKWRGGEEPDRRGRCTGCGGCVGLWRRIFCCGSCKHCN